MERTATYLETDRGVKLASVGQKTNRCDGSCKKIIILASPYPEMMSKSKYLFLLLILPMLSCSKDDDSGPSSEDIFMQNLEVIQNFLDSRGLVAESTPSGLHYIIDNPGTGDEHPRLSSIVEVSYSGYFPDGTVFDETDPGETLEILLSNVILGWQEGIPLFKKGGSGMLLLPSRIAYGNNPPPGFAQNAVLIFDVELVNFR